MLDQLIWYVQNGDDNSQRASAISKLSIKYLNSGNRRVGGVIADFIKDDSINNDLRLFAYLCLLDVSTRTHDEYPDLKTFRFPHDADWDFVEHFASKKGHREGNERHHRHGWVAPFRTNSVAGRNTEAENGTRPV